MGNIKESVHKDFIKLKDNRETYFDEFYKNNYNLVYRICFSILRNKENSEDITQNVFVKILKMPIEKLPSEYESSWLYTVSKNEALQFIRSRKDNVSDAELENIKSNDDGIDNIIDNGDYQEIVKKLNKKQEQIVSLRVISDFTFREIGQIMCMPTATVQWHYYSSIKYLKIALSNFAMFLITFMIGVGVLNSDEKNKKSEENNVNSENELKDHHIMEDGIGIQDSSTQSKNQESISKKPNVDEIIQSTSTAENMSVETSNDSLVHMGIFGIAGVFLIISIIFTIFLTKYKQKLKRKTSKD
ncbi:MAG: sigma-70 family RNA polymerase sigma factor [Clostridia bacterium]|nr:sigma-70 family RNA polymerase sigma factor [Clostridia bacterium]